MRGELALPANTFTRAIVAALAATLLASCSATSDPVVRLGLTAQDLAAAPQSEAQQAPDPAPSDRNYFIVAEDDPVLPDQVSSVPQLQGGAAPVVVAVAAAPETAVQQLAPSAETPPGAVASAPQSQPAEDAQIQARPGADGAYPENIPAQPAVQQPAQKKGFFAALFGNKPAQQQANAAAMARVTPPRDVAPTDTQQALATETAAVTPAAPTPQASPTPATPAEIPTATAFVENVSPSTAPVAAAMDAKRRGFLSSFFSGGEAQAATQPSRPQPVLKLASTGPAAEQVSRREMFNNDPLPGVRQGALFEIKRRSSVDGDSTEDIDLYEGDEYQVASAAGLARLAPNGLLRQTDQVDVACLKPSLVRVLKAVEAHYGRKLIVTSGYRSPPRNKAARGAKNSLHMFCAAADVQVPGVDKWELAAFMRSMPGRGGVGTYCHTKSVHIDVGPERDWNWRCRRRK